HDYRGHTVSTIGEEKKWNPRFGGRDKTNFITFMNNLNLPNPKKIMEAIPANKNCGKI
ncbi:MAG: MBL fold metallo-hydrolase, partial [cyanobacterium endosymbiont of Rhopalodia yunnanensis]